MILVVGTDKYDIDPRRILNIEAIAIKKKTGLDYGPFLEAMSRMDAEALTALVWVARKRIEPTVKFDDIVFAIGDVDYEMTEEERAELEAANEPAPKEQTTESD